MTEQNNTVNCVEECPICLEEINNDIHITTCNHTFHKSCIKKCGILCPLCRVDITDKLPNTNLINPVLNRSARINWEHLSNLNPVTATQNFTINGRNFSNPIIHPDTATSQINYNFTINGRNLSTNSNSNLHPLTSQIYCNFTINIKDLIRL
jgi:hypothetical protein